MKSRVPHALIIFLSLGVVPSLAQGKGKEKTKVKLQTSARENEKEKAATPDETGFVVEDIPKPEPIEGQLGEPGAPSLKEQQDLFAKSLLARGLCNASYYGEEFCAKQSARRIKVTNEVSAQATERELLGERSEQF